MLVVLSLKGNGRTLDVRLGIQVPKIVDRATTAQKKHRKIRDILPDLAALKKDSKKYNNTVREKSTEDELPAKKHISDLKSKIDNLIDVINFCVNDNLLNFFY